MPGLMEIEVQSYGVVVNSGTGAEVAGAVSMGPAPEPGHPARVDLKCISSS